MATKPRAQWTGTFVFRDLVVRGRLFSAESEKPPELTIIPVHIRCQRRLDVPRAGAPKRRVAVERPERGISVTQRVGQAKKGPFCETCGIAVPAEELGRAYVSAEGKAILLTKGELELLEPAPTPEIHVEFISGTDPLIDTFGTSRRMLFVPDPKEDQSVTNYWKVFQALRRQDILAYIRQIVIVRNVYSALIRPVTLDSRITEGEAVDILMLETLRDPRVIKDPHEITDIPPEIDFRPRDLPTFQTRSLDLDSVLTPRIELLRKLIRAREKKTGA